jgi:hypothetical protein
LLRRGINLKAAKRRPKFISLALKNGDIISA